MTGIITKNFLMSHVLLNVGILAHFPLPDEKPQTNLMKALSLLAGKYQNFLSNLAKNCKFKEGVFPTYNC